MRGVRYGAIGKTREAGGMIYVGIFYLACTALCLCEIERAPELPWHD
jgi:hypothetical protein